MVNKIFPYKLEIPLNNNKKIEYCALQYWFILFFIMLITYIM